MILANKYIVPDECPETCKFRGEALAIPQGGICFRCPVMICTGFCLVEPKDFREDWAYEWEEFFKSGVIPSLKLR